MTTFLFLNVRTAPRYEALPSALVFIVLFFASLIVVQTTWNTIHNLASAYYQLKFFGRRFFLQIPLMWQIKYRTPYNIVKPSSSVPRARYPEVIAVYLLYAFAGFGLYFISDFFLTDIAGAMGVWFLALIPSQFFIHGATPAVLLLARSGVESLWLQAVLNKLLYPMICRSLLDPAAEPETGEVARLSNSVARTSKSYESQWQDSVRAMARACPLVVADLRAFSPIVQEEINWIEAHGLSHKLILLMPDLETPYDLSQLTTVFGIRQSEEDILLTVAMHFGFTSRLPRHLRRHGAHQTG
jgi:hypothetical protein